jgi:hypothetical protein
MQLSIEFCLGGTERVPMSAAAAGPVVLLHWPCMCPREHGPEPGCEIEGAGAVH